MTSRAKSTIYRKTEHFQGWQVVRYLAEYTDDTGPHVATIGVRATHPELGLFYRKSVFAIRRTIKQQARGLTPPQGDKLCWGHGAAWENFLKKLT